MRRILSYARGLAMAAILLLSGSCSQNYFFGDDGEHGTIEYVNVFARNTMRAYYLWADEIKDALEAWKVDEPDPVAKVNGLRYRDAEGREMDKWTELYDDFDTFYEAVNGNRKSFGFNFKFYYANEEKTRLVVTVTFTYADSPAVKAGLQRGDLIWEVNGQAMTPDNYLQIANEQLYNADQVTLTLTSGAKKTLTAVQMYENPVHLACVFDCGGKKVGYLHYTSFTVDSCAELIEVCKDFKAQGIRELILDMRYNGGGYADTEDLFASMLAPEADVTAGHILSTEVYNSALTGVYGEQKIPFKTEHTLKQNGIELKFNTQDANLGISCLYAIVSRNSASATEALLGELYPYLPVTLIGDRTHGKYCSGLMIRASDWYGQNAKELGNLAKGKDHVPGWGIYVMYSRFADRDGVTLCMPDGLEPDYSVKDNPMDGYQLGDARETMLAAALALAGGSAPAAQLRSRALTPVLKEFPMDLPAFRIVTPN